MIPHVTLPGTGGGACGPSVLLQFFHSDPVACGEFESRLSAVSVGASLSDILDRVSVFKILFHRVSKILAYLRSCVFQ